MKQVVCLVTLLLSSFFSSHTFCNQPPVPVQNEIAIENREELFEEPANSQPPEIQTKDLWIKMILLLTLIVGFLVLTSWALKKLQTARLLQANKEAIIQVVDRRALSHKSAIWLVDIANIRIAVGESQQQGLHLLHTWNKSEKNQDFSNI